jgi:hypothetical protein
MGWVKDCCIHALHWNEFLMYFFVCLFVFLLKLKYFENFSYIINLIIYLSVFLSHNLISFYFSLIKNHLHSNFRHGYSKIEFSLSVWALHDFPFKNMRWQFQFCTIWMNAFIVGKKKKIEWKTVSVGSKAFTYVRVVRTVCNSNYCCWLCYCLKLLFKKPFVRFKMFEWSSLHKGRAMTWVKSSAE